MPVISIALLKDNAYWFPVLFDYNIMWLYIIVLV